jgi:hypothetical protein
MFAGVLGRGRVIYVRVGRNFGPGRDGDEQDAVVGKREYIAASPPAIASPPTIASKDSIDVSSTDITTISSSNSVDNATIGQAA